MSELTKILVVAGIILAYFATLDVVALFVIKYVTGSWKYASLWQKIALVVCALCATVSMVIFGWLVVHVSLLILA